LDSELVSTTTNIRRPFHVMAKPTGPICNLACRYCFYREKEQLYAAGQKYRMSDGVLTGYVRQYIASQATPEVNFAWQGGEPTMMGLDFFRRALELQKEHADSKRITNSIQTNGTLLDEEWCAFFAAAVILVAFLPWTLALWPPGPRVRALRASPGVVTLAKVAASFLVAGTLVFMAASAHSTRYYTLFAAPVAVLNGLVVEAWMRRAGRSAGAESAATRRSHGITLPVVLVTLGVAAWVVHVARIGPGI
jgi:hypothetical protein